MSERTKKILFSIGFVITTIIMGYMVYIILFPSTQEEPEVAEPLLPSGSLPSSGANTTPTGTSETNTGGGQLSTLPALPTLPPTGQEINPNPRNKLISGGTTSAVVPNADGNGARYYNADDGRFYKINSDGSTKAISDKQFFNVKNVSWGNTTDKTILEFPDGRNVFYDFQTQKQVQLPDHWEDFDFAPTDDKIVGKSIGSDPNNRFLFISNADGSEAKAIEPLGENSDLAFPTWSPGSTIVAYADIGDPQPEGGSQVHFVGANRENIKALNVPGQSFLPNWSPMGKQILYSVWGSQSDGKPQIWIVSGEPKSLGASRRNLKLNTWADKCAWSGETDIYCGVPQELPQYAGLSRDEFRTQPDDIYHIDLKSGSAVKINPPEQNIPIANPVVNKDQSKFFYTDINTGKLYSFDLK
ncbi:hypothetical protein IT408_01015 [Candidatus Uhrbacteria bacterium]|nr:hypothetical protein [Candidatus Uhrbacteria bacterium]